MREPQFTEVVGVGRGQQALADDLNRALGAVERVSDAKPAYGYVGGDGHHSFLPDGSFWARITEREDLASGSASATGTDSGTNFEPPSGSFPDGCPHSFHVRYGFQEVVPLACGGDVDREDGLKGSVDTFPAYELNDALVDVGRRVRMWLGPEGTSANFVDGTGPGPISGSGGCSGSNMQLTRTVQFQATKTCPDGSCVTQTTTINFPFPVEVCVDDDQCPVSSDGHGTDSGDTMGTGSGS